MTEPADSTYDSTRVQFQCGIGIPLRDGIQLSAHLYRPHNQPAAERCVVMLTPYTADSYHERGLYFAAHGLTFLIVDVRGRGNSQGVFRPCIQEAKDGYDVIEWLAQQPYCNGKVAMWGGSYSGFNQWATAKEFPPHLTTIVPAAAGFIGVDFPMRNNIFYPYAVQWLTFTSGHASQRNLFSDRAFWSALYKRWHESGRSFRAIDSFVGNPSGVFQDWLSHPMQDPYWDACNPTADEYARLQLPILTITGSYDDDQPGALEHYRQHMRNASPVGRDRHYLIIGPWDHAGTRTPKQEVGGLKFGSASLLDLPKLHLDWYAWTMCGAIKPPFLQRPVAYYVTGTERWRYADTLEEITAYHEPYFLSSSGSANTVSSSGSLRRSPGSGHPDTYVYDPGEVDAPEIAAEAMVPAGSLIDQRVIFALQGRLLVYHSAPLEKDTEISGFFKLSAWISIDCPDTDFYVSVYEITVNGDSSLLTTDAMRARYRQGLRSPELVRTLEPLRYDFERFTFISRVLSRGSRLRLVIAPVGRVVEGAFWQKNYNAGGTVAEEEGEDARPVCVRLFHDDTRASALYVPIGRPEGPNEPQAPTACFMRDSA